MPRSGARASARFRSGTRWRCRLIYAHLHTSASPSSPVSVRSFLLVDGCRLGLWERARDVGRRTARRRSLPEEVFEDGQVTIQRPAGVFAEVALEFLQLIRGG